MILGHGVDMVSIARVAAVVKAHPHRSQQRIFTPAEWAYAHTHAHPSRALACRVIDHVNAAQCHATT
ncbi:MAG: 4'-phosphopantetheinyl transferase superfamily protein, partial [Alphaproteobacteria bacterium]|nr:4'-phosphopantetheinyl transferase superfamily protein [Alphaproteobacteria bacterium]